MESQEWSENSPKEGKKKGKYQKVWDSSKCRKIWDGFTTFLTIALVAMAIYCVFGVNSQNKTGKLFFPLGYRPVVILSGSMEETLETGGVVLVKQTKNVEQNDIIFFIAEDGSPVIHRYIDNDEEGNIITKGDSNPKEDLEPVTTEQLQGKVVLVMNWLSGPLNFSSWLINKLL